MGIYDTKKGNVPTRTSSSPAKQQKKSSPYDDLMQMASLMGNSAMEAYLREQQAPQSNDFTFHRSGQELPTALRERFEKRSGISLDDVRVHRNSDKPTELGAEAYAQGNEIHLGPGQEEHLEHELGHVVQQKEGRVSANLTINDLSINDDIKLEKEADETLMKPNKKSPTLNRTGEVIQMMKGTYNKKDNTVGENYQVKIGPEIGILAYMDGREVDYEIENDKAVMKMDSLLKNISAIVDEGVKILGESTTSLADKKAILSAFQMNKYLTLDQETKQNVSSFREGAATSMRDSRGFVKPRRRQDAKKITDVFYDFVETPENMDSKLTDQIVLYRAEKVDLGTTEIGNTHNEILPSSTSWNLEMCKGWVREEKDKYVIFEITVPLNYKLMFNSFSPDESQYKFSNHINQEQSEVLLAPSKLTFTSDIREEDGYKILPCSAESFSREKAMELIEKDPKVDEDGAKLIKNYTDLDEDDYKD